MTLQLAARRASLAGELVERLHALLADRRSEPWYACRTDFSRCARLSDLLTPNRLADAGALVDRLSELLSSERVARLSALVDHAPRLVHEP